MNSAVLPLSCLVLLASACTSSSSPSDASASDDGFPSDSLVDHQSPDQGTPDQTATDLTPGDLATDSNQQEIVALPQPPSSLCGKPAHSWLPASEVGSVVSFDEHPLSNMTPSDIEAMVPAGYEYLLPIPYGVRNFKLRYVTQDKGQTVEATAIVGVPTGVPLDSKRPIVLFQHGTTGFMDDCAPSRDLQNGVLASLVLSTRGYITVAPDYIGMLGFGPKSPAGTIHPYLVGEATAIASLDAVRAAANALGDSTELPEADLDRIVLMGGSQGGHATFFTDLYAPYYAPEMTLLGAVADVPPTNLLAHAQASCQTFGDPTTSLVAALVAMSLWYESSVPLSSILVNDDPVHVADELPKIMAEGCGVPEESAYNSIDSPNEIYLPDFLANCSAGTWEQAHPWGCYLQENSVLATSVQRHSNTPFLLLYGEADTLVYTNIERPEVQALCDAGYLLQYRECAGAQHTEVPGQAAEMSLIWIKDRFDGTPLPTNDICIIHEPQPGCGPSL